ncbi:MAG: PAS domain S-box protein [Anaerolineae bacterium]
MVLIALITAISYFVLQRTTILQEHYNEIIHVHSRQRALSQRMAFISSRLVSDAIQRSENRAELEAMIDEIASNYHLLLAGAFPDTGNPAMRVSVDNQLLSIYAEGNPSLSELLDQYIANATALTNDLDTLLSPSNVHYTTIVSTSINLLERLDEVTAIYQSFSDEVFDEANLQEGLLFALTLLVLLLEGIVIFRPLEQSILKKEAQLVTEAAQLKQLAEELARSEARHRLLIDTMHEAFLIFDAQHQITYANTQFYNLLGYSAETIFGRDGLELLHASSLSTVAEQTERRMRGESSTYEVTFKHQKGHYIQALVSGSPIFDTQGSFQGSFITITDITERKQNEQALKQSEARYRTLLDTMNEGFLTANPETGITYCNQRLAHILGRDIDEVVGAKLSDFMDPSSIPTYREHVELRMQGQSTHYEMTFLRKDGQRVYTIISGTPIMDAEGKYVSSFGVVTDITERKNSEQKLQISEARYRQLIENMSEGFVTSDAHHHLNYANPQFANMVGYGPEDLAGRYISDFVDSPSRQSLAEQMAQQHKSSLRHEVTFMRKDGKPIYAMLSSASILDENGDFQGGFAVITDITQRKTMEDALRHSEALYRQLVQNMRDTAVLLFDRDLRYTLAEGPFLEAAGYNKSAMEGRTLHEVISPEAHARLLPLYEAVLRGEEFQFEGTAYRDPDVIYHAFFTPLRDPSGHITGGMIVSRNITQQKHAENEIKDKERLLRTVIDNLPTHVYVKDLESRFILANKAALPNLGVNSESELLGKTDFDFQENAQYFRDIEIDLMAHGAPILDHEESWVSKKTGDVLWFLVNKIPLFDSNGKVSGLVGINHDITERKRMEIARRESEALLRQLTDNIPDIFWIFDLHSDMALFVSPAYERIYGRPLENAKLPPEQRIAFIHPDDRAQFKAEVQLVHTIGHGDFEYRVVHPDGTVRWVRSVNSPIFNEAGELYRIAVVTSDVTERKRTEGILRERQEFIERVTNAVPDVIYILDLISGETLYMNHPLEFSLGYGVEETIQMGDHFVNILMHPDDLARQSEMFGNIKRGENTIVENEYRLWHAAGDWRWFHSRDIVYEWTEDDKPRLVLGVSRDITDFRLAQEATRRSERLLRTVIDNLPVLIYAKDMEHRFVLASQSAVRNLGAQDETGLMGKTDFDIFPEALAQQYYNDEVAVLEHSEPVLNHEEASIRQDTHTNVWYSTNKIPLRDDHGTIIGLVGMNYDITERKRMEDELRDKQRFIERVTTAIPDYIYVYDVQEKRHAYVNRPFGAILGYYDDTQISAQIPSADQFMHPDDRPQQPLLSGSVGAGDAQVVENEYRLKAANGDWHWFHSRDVVYEWAEDGKPRQILGTVRDITEQRKAREVALQLEAEQQRVQVLSNFMRDTSHDFRTPLTIIRASIEIVKRAEDPQKRLDKIAKIERYLDYLVKLLDQLQFMATLDTAQSLPLVNKDVNSIIEYAVQNVSARPGNRELNFALDLQKKIPMIALEADALGRAISNLLENAMAFTPAGGSITIHTHLENDEVVIEIRDTGPGIKPENIAHVFERFYKADDSRALSTGGAGLGLSIVKRVVELHHGTIDVESTYGEGATFRIVLPLNNTQH